MLYIVSNVKVELEENEIKKVIAKKLKINEKGIINFQYYKKAIDSRNKEHIFFLCHFLVEFSTNIINKVIKNKDVNPYKEFNLTIDKVKQDREAIVVGMGPSGLFASYILALSGVKVTLIERGKMVEERIKDVDIFFSEGKLKENSNLQYGEGGAGTFSDGKLTTNINDERINFIKQTFVKFGASEDILYLAKPHIGSDVLIKILKNFRKELIKLGVKILFNTTLIDLKIKQGSLEKIIIKDNESEAITSLKCDNLILATGHSARDIFYLLNEKAIQLARKPFSMGVRIEHKQIEINKSQYGEKYYLNKALPPADYKLAVHLDNKHSLYTFCMCPGGMVVASSSEPFTIVTNGMSYSKRDQENANSALLVNVNEDDLDSGLFAGIEMQAKYEKLAYEISKDYKAPCQLYKDFKENKKSLNYGHIIPSYPLGVCLTNLRECLPNFVIDSLVKGIPLLDKKIKGFALDDALLIAPETRSSSPIRILRDENFQTNVKGIYPIGEGSGYSSGITTSALDGIKVALKIIELLNSE